MITKEQLDKWIETKALSYESCGVQISESDFEQDQWAYDRVKFGLNTFAPILLEMANTIYSANKYLRQVDCSKGGCDPEVGFHQPECCISDDFDRILWQLKELMETK